MAENVVFLGWNFKKKLLPFSKSVPLNFSICEVSRKNFKYLHLLYLGISGLWFEKAIVIIGINILDYFLKQSFMRKRKLLNLQPKLPDFGIFGLKLEYNVISEISVLKFALMHTLVQKWKCLYLRPKMPNDRTQCSRICLII